MELRIGINNRRKQFTGIGDTDGAGSDLLHGVLERERHPIRVPLSNRGNQ